MSDDDKVVSKILSELEDTKAIGKIWKELEAIRVSVIGIDGNNGLRGEVRAMTKRLEEKIAKHDKDFANEKRLREKNDRAFEDFLLTRKNTCLVAVDLEKYKCEQREREAIEKKEKELENKFLEEQRTELKKARLTVLSAIGVALISAGVAILQILWG